MQMHPPASRHRRHRPTTCHTNPPTQDPRLLRSLCISAAWAVLPGPAHVSSRRPVFVGCLATRSLNYRGARTRPYRYRCCPSQPPSGVCRLLVRNTIAMLTSFQLHSLARCSSCPRERPPVHRMLHLWRHTWRHPIAACPAGGPQPH